MTINGASHDFAYVAPPPAGLTDAFRTAASRRTRSAAVTGGAGLLSCVVVLAMLSGGSGQALTQQEPLPPAGPIARLLLTPEDVQPSPTPTPEHAAASAAAARGAAGGAGRAAGRVALPAPSPGSAAEPDDVHGSGTGTGSRYTPAPFNPSYYNPLETQIVNCTWSSSDGLCSRVLVGSQNSDAPYLDLILCNGTTRDRTLSFPWQHEVDVEIRRVGKAGVKPLVWRWGHGQALRASPHQLPLNAATCRTWSTTWTYVDQQGEKLPAGTYEITGVIRSADAAGAANPKMTFTIQ